MILIIYYSPFRAEPQFQDALVASSEYYHLCTTVGVIMEVIWGITNVLHQRHGSLENGNIVLQRIYGCKWKISKRRMRFFLKRVIRARVAVFSSGSLKVQNNIESIKRLGQIFDLSSPFWYNKIDGKIIFLLIIFNHQALTLYISLNVLILRKVHRSSHLIILVLA